MALICSTFSTKKVNSPVVASWLSIYYFSHGTYCFQECLVLSPLESNGKLAPTKGDLLSKSDILQMMLKIQ